MFYIWEHDAGSGRSFFSCNLIDDVGHKENILWQFEKITKKLPEVLTYKSLNGLDPEDFPTVNTGNKYFLVSEKINKILNGFGLKGIDSYSSIIRKPDEAIIENYFTLNIYHTVSCLDKHNSEFEKEFFGYNFTKLSLDLDKCAGEKLFRLEEQATLLIVHEDIVRTLESLNVTGVKFIPVDQYSD